MRGQAIHRDASETGKRAGRRTGGKLRLKLTTAAIGLAALAACAPKPVPLPPPPPPPPPPPVVEVVPWRPLPPGGAAYVMSIPPMGASGRRVTINSDLTDDEKVWHFRSGWNVAALNCVAPEYAAINQAYTRYVNDHQRALVKVNDRLEKLFRQREGSARAALLAREEKLTSAYNFFALPPARRPFCQTMLELSNRALATPPSEPVGFALANFELIQDPFETFFAEYEQYQRESTLWDIKYGAIHGPSQPGWVAVQQARAEGNPHVPSAGDATPGDTLARPAPVTGFVADPQTGTAIPIIPVDNNALSQPVVQPIPDAAPGDGKTTPSPRGSRR